MSVFIIFVLMMMGVFTLRLYRLQGAVSEEDLVAADAHSMSYLTTVEASRGNILDRNGNVLVSNRASYNLVIVNFVLFNSDDPNGNLLKLLDLCESLGIEYNSHFPVTSERPYTYDMESLSSTWQDYFRTFLANRYYDLDISASTLMKNLRKAYSIPEEWTPEQIYKIIAVRYELELRSVDGVGLENYMLAEDVAAEDLAVVMELGVPGVIVESGSVREYNTTYAAHLLGYIGPIYATESDYYREKGYALNAKVGKTGIEYAFEDYLHGSAGTKYTTVSSDGEKLDEYYRTEPVPGNNVELSIDINLQSVAENALEKVILNLRDKGLGEKKEGRDAAGGAVVVQEVKTGEVLACASYPTFDLATMLDNFKLLEADEYNPLWNRALQAPYPPGSIYKMVTAIADIDLGQMSPDYKIEDKGLYTHFEDQGFTPKCHVWSPERPATHGVIDLRQAIAYSCNYYFYESGRLTYNYYMTETGQNPFDLVAKALGLGEPTGVELPEEVGVRANKENKYNMYEGEDSTWYSADMLQSVIGQSLNQFTPMQMCSYVQAVANGGKRMRATFMSRIISWDYQELIKTHEPEVLSEWPISDTAKEALKTGMQMTVSIGTAKNYLYDYPIPVACKTGTAQWQGTTSFGGFGSSDHASFVMYAPVEDPEIAIAVYVEKGAQGGNLANVCIPIMDAYFSSSTKYETVITENVPN